MRLLSMRRGRDAPYAGEVFEYASTMRRLMDIAECFHVCE
jgi:hypothetical protein